jgi:hypothetical protein
VLYKARRKFLYPASGFAFRALPCIAFFEAFFQHAQDVYVAQSDDEPPTPINSEELKKRIAEINRENRSKEE